ncbi:hypothetical protein J3E68DRAFT_433066 [Trichoderma sp. SZMC 28012]
MANSVEILDAVNNVLGLGNRIYNFFSDVKDAPEEVRQMCAQLQLLQKLLPEIERSVSDQVHAMPLNLEIILACLKACETDFNTLWLAVEPLRTERGIIWRDVLNKIAASIKWVVKTEEFEKFTRSLEMAKQTLTLALLLAGVRVDNVMLDGLSSIETKLDTYGRMLNSDIHHVHRKIAFQLEALEHRVQQKIDILSGATDEVHRQNNLRITELYDSVTPNEPLQTGDLSTVQSVDSNVDFAVSSPGTLDIDLVDFQFENQQEDILNQLHTMRISTVACRNTMGIRGYELYPESKLKVLIMELHIESFSGMTTMLKVLREKSKVWAQGRNTQILKETIAKIRRSSQKVMKEVEYLHRRGLRQAHLRLREIDRKQDQVIRALDEQKKILLSMQEEQKALNLINDHQKVV